MTSDRRFRRRREELIDLLREKGIKNERVLEAIAAVPRHRFVEDALRSRAYDDEALPIGQGQTISQPFTVAYQTEMLDPQPGERILEIGTGSGYQAAVLLEMGATVYSIERLRSLHERTRQLLKDLGYRPTLKVADGSLGWEEMAPFDGIIVTAGAGKVPQPLLEQLRDVDSSGSGEAPTDPMSLREEGVIQTQTPGARMIIPVGGSAGQTMLRIVRSGTDSWDHERADGFRFVPLISGS